MSERKKQATERRDFRQTKGNPEVAPKKGKKKNTNRWCKGKVGKEHDYSVNDDLKVGTITFKRKKCSQCSKVKWAKMDSFPWSKSYQD